MAETATEGAVEIDLHELALEWAACRRALVRITDLSSEELDRFAHVAALSLLGLEVEQ